MCNTPWLMLERWFSDSRDDLPADALSETYNTQDCLLSAIIFGWFCKDLRWFLDVFLTSVDFHAPQMTCLLKRTKWRNVCLRSISPHRCDFQNPSFVTNMFLSQIARGRQADHLWDFRFRKLKINYHWTTMKVDNHWMAQRLLVSKSSRSAPLM